MIEAKKAVILTVDEVNILLSAILGEHEHDDLKSLHKKAPDAFSLVVALRDIVRERMEE